MVDSYRQQNRTARPFTPLGTNGALPQLPAPQIQPPELPQIEDRTAPLLQATQQAVERGYQYQAQVLDTAAQAGAAKAANRTQSNAGQAFGAALNAIGSGLLLYSDLENKKQARLAEENAAQLKAQQEAAQGELQIEITQRAADLRSLLGNTAELEGALPTYRQFVNEIATLDYLTPQQRADLINMGMEPLTEAQRLLGTRSRNQADELRSAEIATRQAAFSSSIIQNIVRLRAGSPGRVNPQAEVYDVEAQLNQFAVQNGLGPLETMLLAQSTYTDLNAALLEQGIEAQEFATRQQDSAFAIQEYHQILARTEGNQAQRELELRLLGEQFGFDFGGIVPTDIELMEQELTRRQLTREISDDALRNSPIARDYESAQAWAQALQWMAQPGTSAAAIQRARNSDDYVLQTALTNVELIQGAQEAQRESAARYSELRVEEAELQQRLAEAARKFDPSGTLGPATLTDTWTMSFYQLAAADLERSAISEDELRAIENLTQVEYQRINEERTAIEAETWDAMTPLVQAGISVSEGRINFGASLERVQGRVDELQPAYQQELQRLTQQGYSSQFAPSNFSAGAGVTTPPAVPLATENGVTFPIQADHVGGYVFTSPYKEWRGDRYHWGVDIAPTNPSQDMGARTIGGGTVIRAAGGHNGNFGGLVAVRTPDGFVEQYNHLRDIHVEVGEIIAPGESVGLIGGGAGDRWPGRSTGRHLDFMVYQPGTPDERIATGGYDQTTINPLDYMRMRGSQVEVASSAAGRPNNQPQPGMNNPYLAGQQLWEGSYYQTPTGAPGINRGGATGGTGLENTANPRNPVTVSANRNPYREGVVKNDGEANHGYSILRTDRNVRTQLHRTASRLGIPSQWLADLIAYETMNSWDPGIENNLGCVGLQFCPGGELDQVAWDIGAAPEGQTPSSAARERARDHLRSIGLVGQIKILEDYFVRYANDGADLLSIRHLYAGWNGGPSMIRNPQNLPWDVPRETGLSPIDYHISQIGKFVNRRYDLQSSIRGADYGHTHTTPVSGCALCREQLQRFNQIMPHIGEVA
jgi:murein DD-endopeptidase MepM/ murein hydrolase activator NlpD